MKSFPYRCVLAVAACLLLAMPAWGAEEDTPVPSPSPSADGTAEQVDVQALIDAGRFEEAIVVLRPLLGQEPVDPNVLFLYGLASLEASQRPGRTDEEREILLNEAIAAFHTMLVETPGLVRVRLELARAFYLKGEDGLARRHFEAVLAGGVPDEVAANVNLFLEEIRSRGRWSFNVGFEQLPGQGLHQDVSGRRQRRGRHPGGVRRFVPWRGGQVRVLGLRQQRHVHCGHDQRRGVDPGGTCPRRWPTGGASCRC